MSPPDRRIYLASRSPRRRELLRQIGVAYEVLLYREDPRRGPDVDETPHAGEDPVTYVERMARIKADAAWYAISRRRVPPLPALAADTTVVLDGAILGKPADAEDAFAMLERLSGRPHRVLTAVAVRLGDREEMRLSDSTVELRAMSAAEIRRYVASGEPMDKAGAYGIQGRAAAFVRHLSGSFSGVVGLPLCETAELLAAFDGAQH